MVFCAFSAIAPVSEGADGAIPSDVEPVSTYDALKTAMTDGSEFNIKLTANVSATTDYEAIVLTKSGILDLNGFNITVSDPKDETESVSAKSVFKIDTADIDFTLKDSSTSGKGTIKAPDNAAVVFITYKNNVNLNVNGGTYDSGYGFYYYTETANKTSDGKVEIINAKIVSKSVGVWVSNSKVAGLTISDTEITAENIGVYTLADAVSIEGSKITGGVALEIKSGAVTVKNTNLVGTKDYVEGTDINTNGSGGAVAPVTINNGYTNAAGYNGNVSLTIDADSSISYASTVTTKTALLAVTDGATQTQKNDISISWVGKDNDITVKYLTESSGNEGGLIFVNGTAVVNSAAKFSEAAQKTATGEVKKILIDAGDSDLTGIGGSSGGVAVKFGKNQVTVTGLTVPTNGTLEFSEGSVAMKGSVTAGTMAVDGEAKFSGILGGNAQIDVANKSSLALENVTFDDNAKVVKDEGAAVKTSNVTDSREDKTNGYIQNENGTTAESKPGENATTEMKVGGESKLGLEEGGLVLDATQAVIVYDGDTWTIVPGADITIKGKLVVPEGSKVIVSAGAFLRFDAALAEIDGDIEIQGEDVVDGKTVDAGVVEVKNYSIMNISGSLTMNGDLNVDSFATVKIMQDSTATVNDEGVLSVTDAGKLIVTEGAALSVGGVIDAKNIHNYGTITIDSSVAASSAVTSTIYMMADGAVVDIVDWTAPNGSKITVTDSSLELKKGKNPFKVTAGAENSVDVTITSEKTTVSGITFTQTAKLKEKKTFSGEEDRYTVDSSIDVAGSISVADDDDNEATKPTASVRLDGNSKVTVSSDLVANEGITIVNDGKLEVTGSINVTSDRTTFTNNVQDLTDRGTSGDDSTGITVLDDGKIVTKGAITNAVNAAWYKSEVTVQSAKVTYYNYGSIGAVLTTAGADDTIKTVTVSGVQTLKAGNTVPANLNLVISTNAVMNIGDSENTDVKLEVDAAGKITGAGTIDVDGTLFANNKTKVSNTLDIQSDVYAYQTENDKPVKEGWAKWTSLAIALSESKAGETIQVSTPTLEIKSNITIPADVTVVVTDVTTSFVIKDGATLTIDGTLKTDVDINAETKFAKEAVNRNDDTVDSSAIVVNGVLKSDSVIKYNETPTSTDKNLSTGGAPIAGAYYDDEEGYKCVSPIGIAIADMTKVGSDIRINGKVTVGDIKFTATDDCEKIILENGSIFTASSITLEKSGIVSAAATAARTSPTVLVGGTFNGSVIVGNVTVMFDDVKTFGVSDIDGTMTFDNVAEVKGTVENHPDNASITLSAGTLTAKNALGSSNVDFIVASGATLVSELAADGGSFNKIVIDGTVTVASGKKFDATTVVVMGGGILSVEAATSTTASGIASATELYVGILKAKTTGAVATVNGPVALGSNGTAYIAGDAVLDEAALKVFDDISIKSTQFFVNDGLWMTVYTKNTNMSISSIKEPTASVAGFDIPVENALFLGWLNKDGDLVNNDLIGSSEKVTAKIETEVYRIAILANEGVDDIFIDGQILVKYNGLYLFNGNLSAGTHTITYTLANGYSGDAKLAINGTVEKGAECTVSGLSFTLSGIPDSAKLGFDNDNATSQDITVTFQLTGIEKSGFTPDQPDTPAADNGMTITDYLLIILVVLIVVMAIIVAMRLMRS